jgi:hypothetical protein
MASSAALVRPDGFCFKPSVWGFSFWTVGHSITFLYPSVAPPTDQQKMVIRAFFNILPMLLPCGVCGAHLVKHMQDTPLTDDVLTNRYTLSKWFVDLHNKVNKDLNKPTVSYDDAYRYYLVDSSTYPNGEDADPVGLLYWIIGVVSLLAVLFFVLWMFTLSKLQRKN